MLRFFTIFQYLLLLSITGASYLSAQELSITYSNEKVLQIPYDLNTKNGPILRVELWVTEDGGNTWVLSRTDNDLRPPVQYTPIKDHLYGFYILQMTDVREKPEGPKKGTVPHHLVTMDKKKPELTLELQEKKIFKAGGDIPLTWTVADAHIKELPITIEVSTDDGSTWQKIHEDIKDKTPFMLKAPAKADKGFTIKITAQDKAGNTTSVISEKLFIDLNIPVAKVIGPDYVNQNEMEVKVKTYDEGSSGIASISLWFSLDDGETWKIYAQDLDLQKPIHFVAPRADRIGLFAVAKDKAGNQGIQPEPGLKPQHTVIYDKIAPQLEITKPEVFQSIAGGQKLIIQWKASDNNLHPFPVELYYSIDSGNQWKLITKSEKAEDSFHWEVPKIDVKNVIVKGIARDIVGNLGQTTLPFTFEIDSTPPIAKAMYLENKDVPPKNKSEVQASIEKPKTVDKSPYEEVADLKNDKQYELAMNLLLEIEAKNPEDPRVFYEQALIYSVYFGNDNSLAMNKAINLLEKAISLKPDYESAYILRGNIYYRKYSVEEDQKQKIHYLLLAEHEFSNAIKILGDNYEEYSNLGLVYYRLGRNDEAKAALLKATLLKKRPGLCYWYLARIEENANEFENAEKYWRKAAAAYGVNSIYGEKAVLNAESAKSKKIGQQILE